MASWNPTATLDTLKKRAAILETIREFFKERQVLAVDTPLLSHATVTDPHVIGIPAFFTAHNKEYTCYLQTSPEYAMKRLLAAGSGPIYQISKAFRQGDWGRFHQPEFTLLEWYRPGFDHHALMNEVDELLKEILVTPSAERMTYTKIFDTFLKINPHQISLEELKHIAKKHIAFTGDFTTHHEWLDLLFTHGIQPFIGQERPFFLYDFPVSHAALAKIRNEEDPPVASRFEVYFKGVELANGFHELQDAKEQRQRFEKELSHRPARGLSPITLDERFLSALEYGLPDCAGVALGVDRLILLALHCHSLSEVISFDFERA